MSQTELLRTATDGGNSIPSVGLGKLRALGLSSGGLSFGTRESDSAGALGAFAEIFARMAASDAGSSAGEGGAASATRPTGREDDSHQDDPATQQEPEQRSPANDSSVAVQGTTAAAVIVVESAPETLAIESPLGNAESSGKQDDAGLANEPPLNSFGENTLPSADAVAPADIPDQSANKLQSVAPEANLDIGSKEGPADEQTRYVGAAESDLVDTTESSRRLVTVEEVSGNDIPTAKGWAASSDEAGEQGGRDSQRGRGDRRHGGKHVSAGQEGSSSLPSHGEASPQTGAQASGAISAAAFANNSSEPSSVVTRPDVVSARELPSPAITAVASGVDAAVKVIATAAAKTARPSATTVSGSTSGLSGNSHSGIGNQASPDIAGEKLATANGKQPNSSEAVNRAKLVQRVSKAFQHLGPEGGHVRLRLAPAELGTVRLEMHVHNRRIAARVIAESEAAGNALREHLPELRQRLEAQGIQIERFDIEVDSSEPKSESSLGQRHSQSQQRDADRQSPERDFSSADRGDVSHSVSRGGTEVSEGGGPSSFGHRDGMDVRA